MEKQYGNYLPVYLWVEKFRSINNKGFQFTNEYKYSFDAEKNILTRIKNEQNVSDFYGSDINISAIVGKNGSGKTTLMYAVMQCLNLSTNDAKYILAFSNGTVWSNEDGISYYEFPDNEQELELCDKNCKGKYSYFEPKLPISCIYYTQACEWTDIFPKNSSVIDLSSGNLLEYSVAKNVDNHLSNYRDYFINEFNKQFSFIEKADESIRKVIGFKMPESVQITPVYYDIDKIIESLTSYITEYLDKDDKEELKKYIILKKYCEEKKMSRSKLIYTFFEKEDIEKDDKDLVRDYFAYFINVTFKFSTISDRTFEYYFKNYLSITFLFVLFKRFGGRYNGGIPILFFIKSYFEMIQDEKFDKSDSWERIGILFYHIDNDLNSINKKENEDVIKEIIDLKTFYDYINNDMISKIDLTYECDFVNSKKFELVFDNNKSGVKVPFKISFKEFWIKYEPISRFCDVFSCAWNLSSGEMARLALYSRLYDVIISDRWQKGEYNILYRAENSILLLIDEADMLLHPEWQRTFVDDIITVLPKIFPDQYISVIIATHSPIMLSDVPKQNVLFLENGYDGIKDVDGCDTFAANIFQLFDEAFFINAGIGAYSEKKLKEIVKYIHEENCDKERTIEIKKLISVVADTFLRNKLNEEYLLYHSKITSIEEKQAEKIAALETTNSSLLEDKRMIRNKSIEILTEVKNSLKNKDHIQDTPIEGEREEENKIQSLIDRVDAVLSELQNGIGEKK